jgi:hypothetical protein
MLKQFNSNSRRLSRIVKQINLNNLSGSGYLDNVLDDYKKTYSLSSSFDGRDENGNPLPVEQAKLELSASIQYKYTSSIELPTTNKFNSNTKSNPNPIKLVNNKTKIFDFYQEILEHSARYVSRKIDEFDNEKNTLTIYNVTLDYGTEGASSDNFEVLVYGLHIPGDYTINQIGNNVVITLNDEYIDFDNVTMDDIYVIGKLVDVVLDTEDDFDLRTENDENIII